MSAQTKRAAAPPFCWNINNKRSTANNHRPLIADSRVPNIVKRAMRCHDFGSGREASRSQYLEYWQGERQSPGPKFVPAPGLALDIQMPAPGLRPKPATRRTVEQGPRLRGCDRVGACESRALRRSPVPLRGRIQAHNAWNLLRPARDTLSAGLAIFTICPAPSFASSPILARNARVFHYVRDS